MIRFDRASMFLISIVTCLCSFLFQHADPNFPQLVFCFCIASWRRRDAASYRSNPFYPTRVVLLFLSTEADFLRLSSERQRIGRGIRIEIVTGLSGATAAAHSLGALCRAVHGGCALRGVWQRRCSSDRRRRSAPFVLRCSARRGPGGEEGEAHRGTRLQPVDATRGAMRAELTAALTASDIVPCHCCNLRRSAADRRSVLRTPHSVIRAHADTSQLPSIRVEQPLQ